MNMFGEEQSVFFTVWRGIIIFAASDFIKSGRIITTYCANITGSYFEHHDLCLFIASDVEQELNKLLSYALALTIFSDRQV